MTGPEHYREAERCVELSQFPNGAPDGWRDRAVLLDLAKIHATLAHTAAMAIAFTSDEPVAEEADAWKAALGASSPAT